MTTTSPHAPDLRSAGAPTPDGIRSVCVVGLGYVGLPTAALVARSGFDVLGVDVRDDLVAAIEAGTVAVGEAGLQAVVTGALQSGRLHAARAPRPADVHIIAVPTPIRDDKTADLSHVEEAARAIAPHLRRGDLVILESTSPPGTTEEVVCPLLEAGSGLQRVEDFHACYCPERVMPGNTVGELTGNDRIVGGVSAACAQRALALYRTFVRGGIHLTTARTAEMCKLMENSYRDVNIAFANEVARLCEAEGVDAFEAIRLANLHPRVGILRPGPGVGGHCIPVDPWFLVERHRERATIIRAAREENDATPRVLARRLMAEFGVGAGATVAVLGAAYRANIDDGRESPSAAFCEELRGAGVAVRCWDPRVRSFAVPLTRDLDEALAGCAAAALMVGHDELLGALDPARFARAMAARHLFDAAYLITDVRPWTDHGFRVTGVGR